MNYTAVQRSNRIQCNAGTPVLGHDAPLYAPLWVDQRKTRTHLFFVQTAAACHQQLPLHPPRHPPSRTRSTRVCPPLLPLMLTTKINQHWIQQRDGGRSDLQRLHRWVRVCCCCCSVDRVRGMYSACFALVDRRKRPSHPTACEGHPDGD